MINDMKEKKDLIKRYLLLAPPTIIISIIIIVIEVRLLFDIDLTFKYMGYVYILSSAWLLLGVINISFNNYKNK